MATTANPPAGAFAVQDDPFITGPHDHRHRYSAFDNSQFSLYLNGSPSQAKRALQAHLTETAKRLQEASHLGNALVQQKKELEERLEEIEKQEEDTEIGPELRQRLSELEKEFNEVGRETARVFLPRSRVPSGEADATAGASVFASEALHSPSKVSVPSRKQRNQPSSRINDIAFATEISTSLLAQVKELQAALLQKDEALKVVTLDRSQLEIEVEGLSQRLRTIDESESRLKDVNWSLETQVRELEATTKAAADKEQRLNQTLNVAKSEKASLEHELEELRQQHSKLSEEHVATCKHHETELSSLRRNASMAEAERGALQRKIEDLSNQNKELAMAVAYRMRAEEQAAVDDASPEDGPDSGDAMTPDHSPPPSPSKATPRHGELEAETLKHSLHHAHRMIQQLKNNIHREKTEKVELRRMLQDARDELESSRNPVNGFGSASKKKRGDKDVFKKPARPVRLGNLRSDTQEIRIIEDDDEWEDHVEEKTPSKRPRQADQVPGAFPSGFSSAAETGNEGFETATENSDAFETAHERDGTTTETDAFMTGAETLDGDDGESSDDLTETEAGPSDASRNRRPSLAIAGNRNSFQSTASTSDEEAMDIRTPVQAQHPRYRLKLRQGGYRRTTSSGGQEGTIADNSPAANDSPASHATQSNNSTPAQGKSLFAELGDLSGDSEDGGVADETPSRSLLSPESSPEILRKSAIGKSPLQSMVLPRPMMTDSGVQTEPWEDEKAELPSVVHVGVGTEPETPRRMTMSSIITHGVEPVTVVRPSLFFSSVVGQDITPIAPVVKEIPLPRLDISAVLLQDTVPQSPVIPVVPPLPLELSSVSTQVTDPVAPVVQQALHPLLAVSPIVSTETEPKAAPVDKQMPLPLPIPVPLPAKAAEPEAPVPVALNFSLGSIQATEPQQPAVPMLSQVSSLAVQACEPFQAPTPTLSRVTSAALHTEPVESYKPTLSTSSNMSLQHIQPVPISRPILIHASSVATQETEPIDYPKPTLQYGLNLGVQQTEPKGPTMATTNGVSNVVVVQDTPPEADLSAAVVKDGSRPSTATSTPVVSLSLSGVVSQHVEPEEPRAPSRPVTAHRTVPAPAGMTTSEISTQTDQEKSVNGVPAQPKLGFFGSVLPWSKSTPQESSAARSAAQPLESAPVENGLKVDRRPAVDEGTQTMVSAEQIDKLLLARSQHRPFGSIAAAGVEKRLSPPSSPQKGVSEASRPPPRRPGSSSSIRSRGVSPPPLPPDHKEVIAAAALKAPAAPAAPTSTVGSMGPPILPASAYKKRPQTPVNINTTLPSPRSGTTPRPRPVPRAELARSGASSPITRQSSVSSFASEIDYRFNLAQNPFGHTGFDPSSTDPRMIQAITQTMVGEFLWKYTRKPGREGLSEKRHRRFFWVHPYTRTLYWSDKDPSTAGKEQLKAKSVAIEAVEVVTDDNPYPPGLHRKSLVVITPGRRIQFTAPTGQRHETWFNALSYLLLRTAEERDEEKATSEDVQEFNLTYRSSSRQTGRSRTSMASRVSRPTSSPYQVQVPTLRHPATPSRRPSSLTPNKATSGRLSSLSGALRPGSALRGSFSSRRSRTSAQTASLYESQELPDSAEDLRQVIEEQERNADRLELENVRACCDGKHDVGSLTHKHRHGSHTTSRFSLAGSLSSRSHSRADSYGRNSRAQHHELAAVESNAED